MRNLLLSNFIILLLSGCTFGHYGRLVQTKNVSSKLPSLKPIFGDNFNSFLFKTNISVYGKDFSGLMVTKQMSPKDYRVIFTTELGMKLFDFEFQDTLFTLHYCVPQFNKPKLLKVIQKDIEILLMNNITSKETIDYSDKTGKCNVQKINNDKNSDYYFTEISSKHLVKIEHSKKRIKKSSYILSNYQNDFPSNILIKHYDLKIKIELNLLKR